MKTVVKIPLTIKTIVKIEENMEVKKGDIIASLGEEEIETEINLFQILKVKPSDIFKFLKKRPTDSVNLGDVLAEKKSLLTTLTVKSPVSGKIAEIDLKKGSIIIKTGSDSALSKIITPVNGKVRNISKEAIEIEVQGRKIEAKKGRGKEMLGKLLYIQDAKNSIFDIDSDVEDMIILIKKGSPELIAKLDTLGAKAIISKESGISLNISCLTISDESYNDLSKEDGATVWIRPEANEIIIIEE